MDREGLEVGSGGVGGGKVHGVRVYWAGTRVPFDGTAKSVLVSR